MVHFKLSSTLATCLLSSASLVSSLTVTQADFSALAARLITANSGLTLIDGTFAGNPAQAGTYLNGPQGIADGIILSSGTATTAATPKSGNTASSSFNGPGSSLCSVINPSSSYRDAAVLTLNLSIDKSKFNGLSLSFIFGSEEYPTYVGTQFNDVLGIFVNGKNVAMDNAGKPVTINNGFFASDKVVTNDDSAYGGSTPILTANAPIEVGVSTVKLEIAVCDASDSSLDSAVFLTLVKGISCQNNCEGVAVVATTSTAPLPTINPKCNRDNCLRGLLLKNGNFIEANYSACKTALPTITVIPGPSSTQTITGPASLPTNANVCDGQGADKRLARYISACGCVSVYPVTTTVVAVA